jgi:hypothetical protein
MVTVRATVSFNTVYAAYQHERTDLTHKHGHGKYLEGPLKTYAPALQEFLAAKMREALASTGKLQSAESVAKVIDRAMEDAIGAFAEIVLGEAQREAPLREGTLRASGQVETGRVRAVG